MFRPDSYNVYAYPNKAFLPMAIPTDDVIPVSRTALLQVLHQIQSEQQRLAHADLRPSIHIIQRLLSNKCHSAA